jgi:hypothetical protein
VADDLPGDGPDGNPAFAALGPRYPNLVGKTVPWNQNAMLANGFLSIAMALDVLGEEPATVTRYDAVVKTWVRALIDIGVVKTTAMSNPTYDWCYGSAQHPPTCSEDVGHGGYDFWGIYRAYARPKLGLSMAEVVPFANTFRYLIMQGNGFAGKVSGAGTGGNVGSTWLYAAFLRHDIFPAVGATLTDAARRGDPDTAGRLLWSKYMNARNWQPEERYGDTGMVPPPPVADAGAAEGGDDASTGDTDAGAMGAVGGGTGGRGGDSGKDGTTTPSSGSAQGGGCSLGGTAADGGLLVLVVGALLAPGLGAAEKRPLRQRPART